MGYKLAGYDVIAANDIDPQMAKVYQANHHPKHYFLESISTLHKRNDLPKELYGVDILDGSPPCSTFSMAGGREKFWGKEKTFREGQAKQVLDDLFFEFIQLAKKLQPKVIVAENVKGMLAGNAKGYLLEISKQFSEAGYDVQLFMLNAASMGVPQKRERVFFVCSRKDLGVGKINLSFSCKPVAFKEIYCAGVNDRPLQPKEMILWQNKREGEPSLVEANKRLYGKDGYFKSILVGGNDVCNTVIAGDALVLKDEPRHLNNTELVLAGSFPGDYDFGGLARQYLIGMSVPPVMMAQVSYQVYKQWLSKP